MRSQFSLEFVIDVSFVLVIVAFLVVFFATFTNTNQSTNVMNAMCSEISQSMNTVSNSGGLSTVQYLGLLNLSAGKMYNISVSNGIIIIQAVSVSSRAQALVANTNVVSCGADTMATANESFLSSNLAVYSNDSLVNLAYLSPNYTSISGSTKTIETYPLTLNGGGFSGNSSLSLTYPNGTTTVIAYKQQPFTFNVSDPSSPTCICNLQTGNYVFSLKELNNPSVYVTFPLSKT